MKKAIFIVSVVFFLAGCKKEKIEPVDEPIIESKSGNSKITYSISKEVGSNVVSKSFYKWNSEGHLIEMTSYADSNGLGFRIFQKRQLEYSNNKVSKIILSNFNNDSTLKDQLINIYRYQNNNLMFFSRHFKTFNSNEVADYIDSSTAKFSNDSLIYVVHSKTGTDIVDKVDTTFAQYVDKSDKTRKLHFYNDFKVSTGTIYKLGHYVQINKELNKVVTSIDNTGISTKDVFIFEYLEVNDPLSDLNYLEDVNTYSYQLLDNWQNEFKMNYLPKRIAFGDSVVYNYNYIFDSYGILKETNMSTEFSGMKSTVNTTYFY